MIRILVFVMTMIQIFYLIHNYISLLWIMMIKLCLIIPIKKLWKPYKVQDMMKILVKFKYNNLK